MASSRYCSDLTDDEWSVLAPFLPSAKPGGRPRSVALRRVLDAIFYLLRTGCAWRLLPHDFPCYQTVYRYFRQWRNDGTWQRLHTQLRERVRAQAGREATPSAAVLDSQSVKIAEQRGWRGYDGGKKVHGRKRHLLVDTQGLVLHVVVSPANVPDREGAQVLLESVVGRYPRMHKIWADSGYQGKFVTWVREQFGWEMEVVAHPWAGMTGTWAPKGAVIEWEAIRPRGFHVLPRRWVVERTFAWLGHSRRLSRDVESLLASSEAMIYLVMVRLMIRRLAPSLA